MTPKSAFYLKMFLNQHHKGPVEPVFKLLPPQSQELCLKQNPPQKEITYAFRHPETIMSKIHYSWISDALQNMEASKRGLYLSALPPSVLHQVTKHLGLEKEPAVLKGPLKDFVQKELILKMLPEDHLPLAYLPKTSLDPLLDISKADLIRLIDFLGLFDLAEEMKKILDTKLLKNIYAALDPKEQEFLKICLHQKEKYQTPRFPLNDWNGDAKEIQFRLHKRGLIRFAIALAGQNSSFIWHITRLLDTGRGKRLESLISKEETPQITAVMCTDVLQLLNFFEKNASKSLSTGPIKGEL